MNYKTAIVVLLVVMAFLVGINAGVQSVDPSTIPPEFAPVWALIAFIFLTQTGTVVFTFLRNILGFATSYFKKNRDLAYDDNQLWATWTRFEFYTLTGTKALQVLTAGTPYYQSVVYIVGVVAVLLDLGLGAVKDISEAIKRRQV